MKYILEKAMVGTTPQLTEYEIDVDLSHLSPEQEEVVEEWLMARRLRRQQVLRELDGVMGRIDEVVTHMNRIETLVDVIPGDASLIRGKTSHATRRITEARGYLADARDLTKYE